MTIVFREGNKGPRIIALQQKVLQLNPLGLPRWGADGWLGDETLHSLSVLLDDDTIADDEVVTQAQLDALDALVASSRPKTGQVEYIDRRAQASKIERRGKRSVKEIDICWHQTDCEMGEKPERYDGVPVHFIVTSGGRVIQLHDVDDILHAAHFLNGSTISIEIEGHFEGIEGDISDDSYPDYHKDAGRSPQDIPDIQVAAAKLCVLKIVEQVVAKGGRVRRQVTHRQGIKRKRRRDPGGKAARRIIRPIAESEGIPFDWAHTKGNGEQAPKEWHPSSTAEY
jgi:hypothetical protein